MSLAGPLLSIVVPAYNAAPYLPELCASLQSQSYSNFEVLIGDDGSTDRTADSVAPFLSDHRFRLLKWTENRGVHRATQSLLSQIQGKYWCYPGADDVLLSTFLENRLRWMEAHPEAAIAHGAALVINATGQALNNYVLHPLSPAYLSADRALPVLLQHNIINTPSVMVRTAVTRRILALFQGNWRYAQDYFLWILHLATGGGLLWDAHPQHKYRVHETSLTKRPELTALRRAESRLVPLCALSASQTASPVATTCWHRWGRTLYWLWLRRAWMLHRSGELQPQWLTASAQAYYGAGSSPITLHGELLRHSWGILTTSCREMWFLRRQNFPTGGIAQINDPIFRQASTSPSRQV
jgi:hypothetical protein